ncbi:ATP-grasp domain-containing protein [Labedaea rhizosphaerae]|nr:ATP-grasp domain-containing protein [Labedaea rhizosphaerae]
MGRDSGRPLVAVVYDLGAADALEIIGSARRVCDLLFVCDSGGPDGGFLADRLPQLRDYAEVCDITGMTAAQAADAVAAARPDGIVTFSERRLPVTAMLAQACGLPYHSPELVALLTDKQAQRDALRVAGVDDVRCHRISLSDNDFDLDAVLAEVGLPAIVKPRTGGAASRDTYRVRTRADVLAALHAHPDDEFVIEQLLVGDPSVAGPSWGRRVSVESFVVDGTVVPVGITGKFLLAEPFRETGQFAPATVSAPMAARIEQLTAAAIGALGVRWGATHTELKLTAQGPRVIEVNGRLGGNLADMFRRGAGFDVVGAVLEVALGRMPRQRPKSAARVVYQRYLAPPMRVTTVQELRGLDVVRGLPGVQRVEARIGPGAAVDWRRGTEECLAVVYGSAEDHDELRARVDAIDTAFDPVYADFEESAR